MRVGLFVPCYVDQLAPSVAEATVDGIVADGIVSMSNTPYRRAAILAQRVPQGRPHSHAAYALMTGPSR